MCARVFGPKPSRANAYSIRPEVADVARWQPKADTIAVKMITSENHWPMYVPPKSPNVFPELWKALKPASSVPKPTTWAKIPTTNSTPVSSSVPSSARGTLRPASSVSSPLDAHASKPAHDRNAATTPLITAEGETPLPENENTEKSMPVDGAPPRAKITMTNTIIDKMPTPSMASRIFASTLISRPANRIEMAAATTTITSHGTWYGLSLPGCNFAMNALVNAAVSASVPIANPQ